MKLIAVHIFIIIYFFSGLKALSANEFIADTLNFPLQLSVSDSIKSRPKVDTLLLQKQATLKNQVDLVGMLVKWFKVSNADEKRNSKKFHFSLFPATSNLTGDKVSFTSFNVSFLLGKLADTKVSNIYFYPYFWFGNQYGFQMKPNIWLSKNSWNFTGEYFILNYPQETWGLGGNSSDDNKTMIYYKHLRIYQHALKMIFPNFYAGLGFAYDRHFDISLEETNYSSTIDAYFPQDANNTTSSGITVPILYDSRVNSINPQSGSMASLTYSFYDPAFGSDNSYQSMFYDMRKYFAFPAKKYRILALRSYYWTITKGTAPYLDLPTNRWEPGSGSATRGITQSRYRSNATLYFESEYRFGISNNGLWGGVVFANVLAPSEYQTQNFQYWHPAAGAGVRMKFNKYSNTNIACDAGFSKGYFSIYLNIGEAF